MIRLTDPLPRHLLEIRQIWTTVLTTAVFALGFILICIPFSGSAWFALDAGEVFFYTVAFIVTASAVVVASRAVMCLCRGMKRFSLLAYLGWNLTEVLVVCVIYAFFSYEGQRQGIIFPDRAGFWTFLFRALPYSVVCLGIPFLSCALRASLQNKDNTVRLQNYGNVVSDRPAVPYADKRITLFDNNGVLKFSVSSDNLYFIESDDNYIKVWYTDSAGEMKQYMLRCRLKTVEESFADSELVRCHRKYIVNIRKVSILRSRKEGYKIDFDIDAIGPVPISKTYEQAVLARFNSR